MSVQNQDPDRAPAAAVLVFPGSNGDRDLYEALARAGFAPRYVAASESLPDEVALIGLPGGFSFGDYWRAGMLASRSRAVTELPGFVARGGLILGICNGFQILVAAGLLEGALTYNTPPHFIHRWVELRVTAAAQKSPWFGGSELAEGTRLRLPIAHGEGCYVHPAGQTALAGGAALVYCDNPNGSQEEVAALLDASGRVLGIMPHPERACDEVLSSADGLRILQAAHRYLCSQPGAEGRGPC